MSADTYLCDWDGISHLINQNNNNITVFQGSIILFDSKGAQLSIIEGSVSLRGETTRDRECRLFRGHCAGLLECVGFR